MKLVFSMLNADLIVTRHQGAVEWLADEFGGHVVDDSDADPGIRIVDSVQKGDVYSLKVVGNLPLHLSVFARSVGAIEFDGAPPRGAEYGVEEMRAAGARITWYSVMTADRAQKLNAFVDDISSALNRFDYT